MIGPTRPLLRAGLWFLSVTQAAVGAWALALPRLFFDAFPAPGHPWVALLPPYNEHLTFDHGALTLSLAVAFAVAAVSMDRLLVRTALAANLVFAGPHFVYHALRLDGFPPGDAAAQTATLTATLAISVGLLVLALVPAPASRAPGQSGG